MLIRKSRRWISRLLEGKKFSSVLDYGCGKSAFEYATHACDIMDHSNFYADKKISFLVSNNFSPFHNSQFDFVFTSHIAEHVDDPEEFCKELMRVGKAGYIEVPSPLFDNLVYGNRDAHKWWVEFCDDKGKLIFSPQVNILNECISPKDNTLLYKYFRGSIVTELYWEGSFEFEVRKKFTYHFSPSDREVA
jgi:SAM-dependent methyltransferase